MCNGNTTTNVGGIPLLRSTNTTVGTETVDIALGFSSRTLSPIGYFTIQISDEVPADTTGTLPVTITFNGITRALTLFNGTPVQASDILGGTGFLLIFNNRFTGTLQLMSRTTV